MPGFGIYDKASDQWGVLLRILWWEEGWRYRVPPALFFVPPRC